MSDDEDKYAEISPPQAVHDIASDEKFGLATELKTQISNELNVIICRCDCLFIDQFV